MKNDGSEAGQTTVGSRRVILGSGRSGTTWVLDCLANANELRPIFEPLHPNESAIGLKYAYAVMTGDDSDEELESYFVDLALGQVRSRWIDYRMPRGLLAPDPRRLLSREYVGSWANGWRKHLRDRGALRLSAGRSDTLLKCIRANLLAGWLTNKLGFRTVLVVRHPCATIESQHRGGKTWCPDRILERYRNNSRLHEVTENRYVALLARKLSTTQAMALRWLIENQWPIEQSRKDGYLVVCYEHLLRRPGEMWPVVCRALGLSRLPEVKSLNKPSQQASGAYILEQNESGLKSPRWVSNLTNPQLKEIQVVLDEAGFTLYDTQEDLPTYTP